MVLKVKSDAGRFSIIWERVREANSQTLIPRESETVSEA